MESREAAETEAVVERDALFGTASSSKRRDEAGSGRAWDGDFEETTAEALHDVLGRRDDLPTCSAGSRTTQQRSQQQQQQLSWAQVRGSIDVAERQRGLRSAYESVDIGRNTLESLDDQKGASHEAEHH